MPNADAETVTKSPVETRGFREDLLAFGAALPCKALFFALLAAWVALFHFWGNSTFGYANTPSIFGWLREVYRYAPDDENLGMMIVPAILALLWWKREDLGASPKSVWWPGIATFAGAVALHIVGYVVQQPRVSLVALFFGIYALTGVLWGRSWLRATFFPLFLFAFAVPPPLDLEGMTLPLRIISTKIAVWIGHHLIGITDVARNGTTITFPFRHINYEVEAACSGLRSLTVMTLISSIFAFVFFRSPWRRALIIFSAVPLAIISNSLRLLSIILAGDWRFSQLKNAVSLDEARDGAQSFGLYVHDHAVLKLLPYVLGFTCLMLLARWLRDDAPATAQKGTS